MLDTNIYICTVCHKTGYLADFCYHETSPRTNGNHSNDWEESSGYYTCCTSEDTLIEAVMCAQCDEYKDPDDIIDHVCEDCWAGTDETDVTKPSPEAIIKVCLDQLAEIVAQIGAVNDTLREAMK